MRLSRKTGALAGLAALATVGGTWAFYNQTAAIANPFQTTSYGSTMIEHFNPSEGQGWKPGAQVEKTVAAKNTGNADLLVRVSMKETWSREEIPFAVIGSGNGAVFNSVDQTDKLALQYDGEPSDLLTAAEDGLVPAFPSYDSGNSFQKADQSVVFKALNLTDEGWIDGGDGYWYWNRRLEAGAATTNLLESVVLAVNTDMGRFEKNYAYFIGDASTDPAAITNWTEVENEEQLIEASKDLPTEKEFFMKSENKQNETARGYSDAAYDLEITTEFLQATGEALDASADWSSAPDSVKALVGTP